MLTYEDLVPNEHFGFLFFIENGLMKQKSVVDICYLIQSFWMCDVAYSHNKFIHNLQNLFNLSYDKRIT